VKYIYINIEGWLGGTVFQYLTKAEVAIWSELVVLGGKGTNSRYGFVELSRNLPFSRSQLLTECNCFSDEDIATFDSCMDKCVNGHDGDAPRLILHPNGVIEIINWSTYQHPDFPKGYTPDEAKALKKERTAEKAAYKGEPISQTIYDAKEKERVAKGVITQTQTVIDALKEKRCSVVDDDTGEKLPTSKEKEIGNE
jgi:hypothetical protein